MAKKKIGTSNVVNGEARDWFNLDQSLERGVYQLIAEYSGSSTYKPSYDTKKLIVGLYSELQDLDANYKILDKNVRRITITGTLYGYNELNLQVDFILLLDEFVYPSVTIDDVYQEVLEQAENFKKYVN